MTIQQAYLALCADRSGVAPALSYTMGVLTALVESVRIQCAQAAAGTETQEDDSDATRSAIVARIEALVLA